MRDEYDKYLRLDQKETDFAAISLRAILQSKDTEAAISKR